MPKRFPAPTVPRVALLAALVGALSLATPVARGQAPQPDQTPWPTTGWSRGTPDSQGLDPSAFGALDRDIRAGTYGHIDRLLVIRNGRLVVDGRYAQDYREISRGKVGPLGCGEGCADPAWLGDYNYYSPDVHPYYRGREVHTLQSVTKPIAASVVGAALEQGRIASLDRPFLEFFAAHDLSKVDPRLRKATLRDLLTMRSGIEWHEQDRGLDDDTNTTLQLERSRDWIRFTLDQPVDAAPGTKWAYNSGGTLLLSEVVRSATGRQIDAYAGERLFRPIGISTWYWKKTPTGLPDAAGGLYLRAEDLAKIGYLYLQDGMWNGTRILPEGFVREATSRQVRQVNPAYDFGYQWWLTSPDRLGVAAAGGGRRPVDVWAALGFGGQRLIVIPSRQIIAVVYAWNVFGEQTRDVMSPLLGALLQERASGAGHWATGTRH